MKKLKNWIKNTAIGLGLATTGCVGLCVVAAFCIAIYAAGIALSGLIIWGTWSLIVWLIPAMAVCSISYSVSCGIAVIIWFINILIRTILDKVKL